MYPFFVFVYWTPSLHRCHFRACIVSVLRLTSLAASNLSKDVSWDKVDSAFYGAIEPNAGIFFSSIVTLRPLFRHHLPWVGLWFDGLGKRHVSLNSYNDDVGRAPARERSNTTEASGEPGSATEVELSAMKAISSSVTETVSISTDSHDICMPAEEGHTASNSSRMPTH
jgi:hypothetical protein